MSKESKKVETLILSSEKSLEELDFRRVLQTDENLNFKAVDGLENIPFSATTDLSDGQVYVLTQFSSKSYFPEYWKEPFNGASYDEVSRADISKIEYLIFIAGDKLYFQKVKKSLFIKRPVLWFGINPSVESSKGSIVISETPDLIYDVAKDSLFFWNIVAAKSILRGLEDVYQEATEEDVKEFLGHTSFELSDGFNAMKVGVANRKRITWAKEILNGMSKKGIKEMHDYMSEYVDVPYDSKKKKILISTDEHLKNLIYGLDERFYKTSRTKKKRIATSISGLS